MSGFRLETGERPFDWTLKTEHGRYDEKIRSNSKEQNWVIYNLANEKLSYGACIILRTRQKLE